jgi:Fe2+ transport system protein FeoA
MEIGPFEGPVVVESQGQQLYLGHKTASAIFVEAVPSAAERSILR